MKKCFFKHLFINWNWSFKINFICNALWTCIKYEQNLNNKKSQYLIKQVSQLRLLSVYLISVGTLTSSLSGWTQRSGSLPWRFCCPRVARRVNGWSSTWWHLKDGRSSSEPHYLYTSTHTLENPHWLVKSKTIDCWHTGTKYKNIFIRLYIYVDNKKYK